MTLFKICFWMMCLTFLTLLAVTFALGEVPRYIMNRIGLCLIISISGMIVSVACSPPVVIIKKDDD